MRPAFYLMLLGTTLLAQTAKAQTELRCNKEQTLCEVESLRLVTGDQVAIFNDHNQVVAEGEVTKVRQDHRRTIKITKKYGRIRKHYRFTILNTKDRARPKSYDIYREPILSNWGANLGVITLSFGSGGVGTEISGFYQMLVGNRVPLLFRGAYILAKADVADKTAKVAETSTLSVTGIGGLVGTSIVIWTHNNLGFRFEGGGGIFMASASVSDGDLGDYDTRFSNGLGFWLRGAAGALYDMGNYFLTLEAAPQYIHQATGIAIVLGIGQDL